MRRQALKALRKCLKLILSICINLCHGQVLDATFDDLLPLAQKHMPSSWSSLVKEVVRSYVDLNVADLLRHYEGPVRLVRRTNDEIICLT